MKKLIFILVFLPFTIFATDLDNDGIEDSEDLILRNPLIDRSNGINRHLGEYTLELKKGWQTVSLPVDTVLRPDIEDYSFNNDMNEFSDIYVDRYANFKIFGEYKIIWQYIDGIWRAYSEDREIRDLIVSNGYELIFELNKDHAFWIKMQGDRFVTFYGKKYIEDLDSYPLSQWSLISFSGGISDFFKELSGIETSWEWRDGKWTNEPDYIYNSAWIYKTKDTNSSFKIFNDGMISFFNGDYEIAKRKFESSLDLSISKNMLGNIFYDGYGVEKDYKKAKEYYLDSLDLDISRVGLFSLYLYGYGVDKNETKAKEYLDSYDGSSSLIYNALGKVYEYGLSVDENHSKAKEYYEKAILKYSSSGMENLANLYNYGKGVDKNTSKAMDLYVNAAFKNNSNAQYKIGYNYFLGNCFSQDYTKARKWFEKSAFMNENSSSYHFLGIMYENGFGVDQNYEKAKEYYTKAMEINLSGTSVVHLGYMYLNAKGVEQDYDKAIGLFKLSADNNNPIGEYTLGYMYLNGIGTSIDYVKAYEYFSLAAEEEISMAQSIIGMMYHSGIYLSQSYQKAYEWFLKAAENDDYDSMAWLGLYYLNGYIETDYQKAYAWYIKAASNGNNYAQADIGYLYYNGYGVSQNKNKSYCWFKYAGANGNSNAIESAEWMEDYGEVNTPVDCSIIDEEIETYKDVEEKEQCSNLDSLLKEAD